MRIAFDSQIFCLQRTGGISRYFCKLAEGLFDAENEVGIFAPYHRNLYLGVLPDGVVHGTGPHKYLPRTAGLMARVNALRAERSLRAWVPEIVHETYFSPRPALSGHQPVVLTVFDMISEMPEFNPVGVVARAQSPKYQAVMRADHIVCISESTRSDLLNIFDVDSRKISVVHLGCELPQKNPQKDDVTQSSLPQSPYLLYIGQREGYKNFAALIQALGRSASLKNKIHLVAFGGGPFSEEEQSLLRQSDIGASFVSQIEGDDALLAQAYQGATALVYPSVYEGFGLPPIEAMAYGCPVISSNTSSMPEVIGSAAESFDPLQIDEISAAIERVVYSDTRRSELIRLGVLRAKLFSWQECASKTATIYRDLL
jgi:glycosyltransferase involved in cell wall biosynthesis